MTLRLGEVVLIRMLFHQAPGSKVRPALVLLDAGDNDFVAAPITSQLNALKPANLLDYRSLTLRVTVQAD